MYAVIYGYNGQAGATLAVGLTYHKAQQVALRDYNDIARMDNAKSGVAWEDVNWHTMCKYYAEQDQYVLTIELP